MGDEFLYDITDRLKNMKSEARRHNKEPPFLFQNFKLSLWYQCPSARSSEIPAICRILNSLIDAMNANHHLPQYILIMPDCDIIKSIDIYDYGTRQAFSEDLSWLLRKVSRYLLLRWEDLKNKNPGAVAMAPTKVIWCKMLSRPISDDREYSKIWKCKTKFNNELENILQLEEFMHLIEIPNMEEVLYFSANGELSHRGQTEFWRNLNSEVRHLLIQLHLTNNNKKQIVNS